MAVKKLSLLTLLILSSSQVNAICKNNNATCPEYTPCCSDGWCFHLGHHCIATICDPSNSYSPDSCYPKPQCESFSEDFSKNDLIEFTEFDGNPKGGYEWVSEFDKHHAVIQNDELVLSMTLGTKKNSEGNLQGVGATVSYVRWIQYGTVTAKVKTASVTPGVVTSFIIRSSEGDEIDFEWVGKSPNDVQTNYYYYKDQKDWRNMNSTSVGSDTSAGFNEYKFQWEEEFIKWYVNNKLVRTLYKKDTYDEKSKVYKYPSQLAQVKFGIWDGGRGSNGTEYWAGGPTNWSNPNTVYKAYFDSVQIECQSNGNAVQLFPTSVIPASTSTTKSTSIEASSKASSSSESKSTSVSDTSLLPPSPASLSSSNGLSASVAHQTVETHAHGNSAPSVKASSVLLGAIYFFTHYVLNL
ncbi:putative glycosidase CRH2 [Basidiobolus ranarum]|uniref:Glycosidase CRH2 n=1 Tax=Basidiobolus ranarum TaxID=34480 RepID=A0ABR2VVA3_9FUNG